MFISELLVLCLQTYLISQGKVAWVNNFFEGEQMFPMASLIMFQGERRQTDKLTTKSRRLEKRQKEFLSLNVQVFNNEDCSFKLDRLTV